MLLLIGCAALLCYNSCMRWLVVLLLYACGVPGVGSDWFLVSGYIFVFLLISSAMILLIS